MIKPKKTSKSLNKSKSDKKINKKNQEEILSIDSDIDSDYNYDTQNELPVDNDINELSNISDNDLITDTDINQDNQEIITSNSINYFTENIECNNHDYNKKNIIVDKDKRITDPYLTKYEYIRCLSERTKQIELGAKIMIKNANELQKIKTSKELADYEIKITKSCPLIIVRELPNNTEEHWDINELDILFN